MASRSLNCPRCGGAMEQGFIVDQTESGTSVPHWVAGEPEASMWTGLKLRGKEKLTVTTYRCRQCGYLESYA